MKHDNHKIVQSLKNLRSVKPADDFKISLRNRIYAELGENFVMSRSDLRLHEQGGKTSVVSRLFPQPLSFSFINQRMLTSLLLIMALLSGSVGTTHAAQSALPGDALYPVKIASEKARSAVTINDVKETELHGKFAERRLKEIAELSAQKTVTPELVKEAVDGYKAEISESRGVMQSAIRSADTASATEIAKLISESSHRDRLELSRLSREIRDKESDNYLREAWNEATAHEDLAILAMLASFTSNNLTTASATSTPSTTNATSTPIVAQATSTPAVSYELQARVANKISEAAHKIGEVENYIALKASAGANPTQANAAIILAKTTLAEATTLAAAGNYQEAFVKAKLAHELAENAKDVIKSRGKDKERDDDNFYVAKYLEQMNAAATSTVSAPMPIIWRDLDDARESDHK
ncbi:MAG: hypothetical protein HZA25_00105, partial [Candidatus Niyogibacteria bacterium]|nr:hypothetical protein [Candidatus Niyogibacteria bacterium]